MKKLFKEKVRGKIREVRKMGLGCCKKSKLHIIEL